MYVTRSKEEDGYGCWLESNPYSTTAAPAIASRFSFLAPSVVIAVVSLVLVIEWYKSVVYTFRKWSADVWTNNEHWPQDEKYIATGGQVICSSTRLPVFSWNDTLEHGEDATHGCSDATTGTGGAIGSTQEEIQVLNTVLMLRHTTFALDAYKRSNKDSSWEIIEKMCFKDEMILMAILLYCETIESDLKLHGYSPG